MIVQFLLYFIFFFIQETHSFYWPARNIISNRATLELSPLSCTCQKLTDFLQDSAALGTVRFVVVGNGAILETIGSFSNLRYSETTKGRLATLSSDNPIFECHIRLSQVKVIKMIEVSKALPTGANKLLYVVRFLSAEGETLLSSILHGVEGRENITSWTSLKEKYCGNSDSFTFEQ